MGSVYIATYKQCDYYGDEDLTVEVFRKVTDAMAWLNRQLQDNTQCDHDKMCITSPQLRDYRAYCECIGCYDSVSIEEKELS